MAHTHEDDPERQGISLEFLERFEAVGCGYIVLFCFLHVVDEYLMSFYQHW
jgi:hypothetical protein